MYRQVVKNSARWTALFLFLTSMNFAVAQSQSDTGKGDDKSWRLERDGIVVEFNAKPNSQQSKIREGEYADLSFRITDAQSGQPVRGIYPAAWMDIGQAWNRRGEDKPMTCKQRVGMYLQGNVGMRPMVDLNSYFVLVMNQDNTISVIDPIVGISGITKLYGLINLKRPGADWAKSSDEKLMYVTMPTIGELAVVNLENFKVVENIPAGEVPTRVSIQPDGKYLWVANNHRDAKKSGVTIIDTDTRKIVGFVATGNGHHELTFSGDSRFAYVSNRRSGTVSVVDVQKLKKLRDLKIGEQPISLAYSAMSQSVYVADGQSGKISVIDTKNNKVVKTVTAKQGLGPMRFSQDGRWGMAVNTLEHVVYALDASNNTIAHTIKVEDKPYQVAFSRAFAYVRSLDSERVSMIELAHLGKGKIPVITFQAGPVAPGKVNDVSIADNIQETPGEAAVLVVSPGDNTVYYYMEGMNAPMGNFRNYGHRPRAVAVADRTLSETHPGTYTATVKVPASGIYDVALLLETPRIVHCFEMAAEPNPELAPLASLPASVEYQVAADRRVQSSDKMHLRFKLIDADGKTPLSDLKQVRVRYYRAPGQDRREVSAREVEKGVYETELNLAKGGAYYVYVSADGGEDQFKQLPFLTLMVREQVVMQ